jgi:pheromone a factor receptor
MADIPFTIFSAIGFLICIPPAYFNWKIPSRPWATLIFIGWIFILNLLSFMDSIIWGGSNPDDWWDGQVYCDINSRIKSAFPIGVPGAAIGICRFLAQATDPDPSQTELKSNIRKRNMIDLFLGVVLPVVNMGFKYIVNPSRYYIVGVAGCTGITQPTWAAVPLYELWSPLLSLVAAIYAGISLSSLANVGIFLRHWWVRRKRLNDSWALGMRNGISQIEFRRLVFTVLTVIFLYFPLSVLVLAQFVHLHMVPFSWEQIHGPMWWIIVKEAAPTVHWASWIGPTLALTSFLFIGTTRNARRFYEHCVEWIYDIIPTTLQDRFSGMRKISETCKRRRTAAGTITGRTGEMNVSMVEGHREATRGRPVMNWFDSDDEVCDAKSLQSSEATLTVRDQEEGNTDSGPPVGSISPYASTAQTEGTGGMQNWSQGITVTRQVIVETSSR